MNVRFEKPTKTDNKALRLKKIYCYKRSEKKVVIVVLIVRNKADVSRPFSISLIAVADRI